MNVSGKRKHDEDEASVVVGSHVFIPAATAQGLEAQRYQVFGVDKTYCHQEFHQSSSHYKKEARSFEIPRCDTIDHLPSHSGNTGSWPGNYVSNEFGVPKSWSYDLKDFSLPAGHLGPGRGTQPISESFMPPRQHTKSEESLSSESSDILKPLPFVLPPEDAADAYQGNPRPFKNSVYPFCSDSSGSDTNIKPGNNDHIIHDSTKSNAFPGASGGGGSKSVIAESHEQVQNNSANGDDWDSIIHRNFVMSIFHCGLQKSSPCIILDEMKLKTDDVTSERVKSHLQKFRQNKEKAIDEFIKSYDGALETIVAAKQDFRGGRPQDLEKFACCNVAKSKSGLLLGGEVAALLSAKSMFDTSEFALEEKESQQNSPFAAKGEGERSVDAPLAFMKNYLEGRSLNEIELPALLEEEKKSPLGSSLCYIMGLFFSLKQHILEQREIKSMPFATEPHKYEKHVVCASKKLRVSPPLEDVEHL